MTVEEEYEVRLMSKMSSCKQCIREHRSLAYCLQMHPPVLRVCKPPNSAALRKRKERSLAEDRARQQLQEEERQRVERELALQALAERDRAAKQALEEEAAREKRDREEDEAPPIRRKRPRVLHRLHQLPDSSDGEEGLDTGLRRDDGPGSAAEFGLSEDGGEGQSEDEEKEDSNRNRRGGASPTAQMGSSPLKGGSCRKSFPTMQLKGGPPPPRRGLLMVKLVHGERKTFKHVPFCAQKPCLGKMQARSKQTDKSLSLPARQHRRFCLTRRCTEEPFANRSNPAFNEKHPLAYDHCEAHIPWKCAIHDCKERVLARFATRAYNQIHQNAYDFCPEHMTRNQGYWRGYQVQKALPDDFTEEMLGKGVLEKLDRIRESQFQIEEFCRRDTDGVVVVCTDRCAGTRVCIKVLETVLTRAGGGTCGGAERGIVKVECPPLAPHGDISDASGVYAIVIPTVISSETRAQVQAGLGPERKISRILETLEHISTKFDIIKVCGAGAYGIVLHCRGIHGGPTCAIKVFTSDDVSWASMNCSTEHSILDKLTCSKLGVAVPGSDAVVQLRRWSAPPLVANGLIHVRGKARAIVMEHFDTAASGRSFFECAQSNPNIWCGPSPALVHGYMCALFTALQSLERSKFLHSDVKPANFLYHPEKGKGCLVDLGLAKSYDSDGFVVGACGTQGYRSPEICDGSHTCTSSAADVWSAGVCMLLLLKGTYSAHPDDETKLHDKISRRKVIEETVAMWRKTWPLRDSMQDTLKCPDTAFGNSHADPVRDLLDKILHLEHTDRPSASKVLLDLGTTSALWGKDVAAQCPSSVTSC